MPDPKDKKKQGIGPSLDEVISKINKEGREAGYGTNAYRPLQDPDWLTKERAETNSLFDRVLGTPQPDGITDHIARLFFKIPVGKPQVYYTKEDESLNPSSMAALDMLDKYPATAKHIGRVFTGVDLPTDRIADFNPAQRQIRLGNYVPLDRYPMARGIMAHEMSHAMGVPDNYRNPDTFGASNMDQANKSLFYNRPYKQDILLPYDPKPTKGIGPSKNAKVKK